MPIKLVRDSGYQTWATIISDIQLGSNDYLFDYSVFDIEVGNGNGVYACRLYITIGATYFTANIAYLRNTISFARTSNSILMLTPMPDVSVRITPIRTFATFNFVWQPTGSTTLPDGATQI